MRLPGKSSRFALTGSFWTCFKRLDWRHFVPGGRVGERWLRSTRRGVARQRHRTRPRGMKLVRWRRTAQGLPCWGLGAVAGWPWG